MVWFQKLFTRKWLQLPVTKAQKELLEFFILNKEEFDSWAGKHPDGKIRFQFFYPTAIDFHYGGFRLFTAYFKKGFKDNIELSELKMTETNYDSIRSTNWKPFETIILQFLTTLEESKKNALFEKRRELAEYEMLCSKNNSFEEKGAQDYLDGAAQWRVAK